MKRFTIKKTSRFHCLGWIIVLCISGCAVAPPVATPTAPGVAPPMTLPRYLGVNSVAHGMHRVIYRSRLRLSTYIPALEPAPAAAAPMALGDPACLQSPAPAVAAAASIQQAEAAAPAKVKALAYLATIDCSRNPQVEEAILAALDDPSDSVRIAAIQAVVDGASHCGPCASGCGGCCTPAIRSKLMRMATETLPNGCFFEPNAKARRLARIAMEQCGPSTQIATLGPEEVPPAAVVEWTLQPPTP
ncbi:MAG: hypothetical protein U0905_03600 [Pirellulales bacterium]